jgi:L,D-transpeptidase catalytic domain
MFLTFHAGSSTVFGVCVMIVLRLRKLAVIAVAMIGLPLATVAPAGADVVVAINKAAQRVSVFVDGAQRYSWAVSTGVRGGPHNGSYRPQRLERSWYSRKYHRAPMPHSIFFDGNYAIHGTVHVRNLGRRASKGCVRLHPANAAVLFDLVRRNGAGKTRIVVSNAAYAIAPVERAVAPRAVPAGQAPDAAKEHGTAGKVPDAAAASERDDAPLALKSSLDQSALVPGAGEPVAAAQPDDDTADGGSALFEE